MIHTDALPITGHAPAQLNAARKTGTHSTYSTRAPMPEQLVQVRAVITDTGDDPVLDGLVVAMILTAGARPQTVLDLTLGDIDEAECSVAFDERFDRTTYQPIPDWFTTDLLEFARSRGARHPEDRVFRYSSDSRRAGTPFGYLMGMGSGDLLAGYDLGDTARAALRPLEELAARRDQARREQGRG